MPTLPIEHLDDRIPAGEAFLAETRVLHGQTGTQPDLFLRWNAIPAEVETVDVVVHLHGFSTQGGEMRLAEKVPRSGLDLSGRERPTLAVLPRGNWIRHTWYDFPALLDGGLDRLVDYAVARFAQGRSLTVDRLILSGHSGGGMPAVDAIAGARRPPDELHIFDGLYGRDPAGGDPLQGIEIIDAWLAGRMAREPQCPGALRVVYIERQTGAFSREVGKLIERYLAAAAPGLQPILAPRYRVEPAAVPHAYVAAICGPVLLADPGAEFDWARIV